MIDSINSLYTLDLEVNNTICNNLSIPINKVIDRVVDPIVRQSCDEYVPSGCWGTMDEQLYQLYLMVVRCIEERVESNNF